MYQRENLFLSIEAMTLGYLARILGWSKDECQVITAEARKELRDPKLHLYTLFHFIYGRRPDIPVED